MLGSFLEAALNINSRLMKPCLTHSLNLLSLSFGLLFFFSLFLPSATLARSLIPETVTFNSADDKVKLIGFMYLPDAKLWPDARPAVVMLHGRSGIYSSSAKHHDATTLAARTVLWGKFWADRGYIGLYIDTFGPRGYFKGFEAGTNNGSRPREINEITVRPFDAYMGLKYLRSRTDVQKNNVFLQGWSNGGSAALSTMARDSVGFEKPTPETGFRAAIAVYPACTPVSKHYGSRYQTYAPLMLLIGTEDEEVSVAKCEKLVGDSPSSALNNADGGDLIFVRYIGAQHSYDTPSSKRQAVAANVAATEDTKLRAEAFFKKHLVVPFEK